MNRRAVFWVIAVLLLGVSLSIFLNKPAMQKRSGMMKPLMLCEEVPSPVLYPELKIDNTTPLEELITVSYPLEELYGFFGSITLNERKLYEYQLLSADERRSWYSFSEVDMRFPVENIRCSFPGITPYTCLYTVYRVSEGGLFYVFWVDIAHQMYPEQLCTADTLYLPQLPAQEQFTFIIPGISTASDVANIDPSTYIDHALATHTPSCSILSNGSAILFCYEWRKDNLANHERTRDNLVLVSKEIVSLEDAQRYTRIAGIFPKDLP